MKSLILILTTSSILFGQTDPISTLSYFPLQIGNEWCYRRYISHYSGTKETLIKETIICDTLMPNGKKYYGMQNDSTKGIVYYRTNNENKKVFIYSEFVDSSEIFYYDFNTNQTMYNSDLLGPINVTTGIDSIKYLMLYKPFVEFSYQSSYGIVKTGFSEENGRTWYNHKEPSETIYDELIYATIDGKYFGETTSIQKKSNLNNSKEFIVNYPNPFNSQTTLVYKLTNSGNVIIKIYNSLGELVKEFKPLYRSEGQYEQKLEMGNYNSGIYFCQLNINNKTYIKKILYLK